jgi:hypothetical protein
MGRIRGTAAAVAVLAGAMLSETPLQAQHLIARTPGLANSVNAMPGMLEAFMAHGFTRAAGVDGLTMTSTFDLAAGLPWLLPVHWTAGVRFTPASALFAADEWEAYERVGLLRQDAGAPVDLNVTGAYNFTASSIDGEVALARRFGPLRLIGAARALTAPLAGADARFAAAAGAAWHVAARHSPVTLAADVALLSDRSTGEHPAWHVAVQAGLRRTAIPWKSLAGSPSAGSTSRTSSRRARSITAMPGVSPTATWGIVTGFGPRSVM